MKVEGSRTLLSRHIVRKTTVEACRVDVEHFGATGHCVSPFTISALPSAAMGMLPLASSLS